MKINKINKYIQIYKSQENKKVNKFQKSSKKDELKLSNKALDFQFAVKALNKVPDIRHEKVEKIKQQIKTGTYKVDGKKIVEKMFETINFDKRV